MTSRLLRLLHDEGGWIQAALMGAGLLGKLFGGGAKASADQRMQEALLGAQRDRTQADVYGTAQDAQFKNANTDLQRREFSQQARPANAQQVALGDLLKNIQDVHIQPPPGVHMGQISGGLRPSVFGENTRQAGGELSRQALAKLLAGEQFDPIQMLRPPTPTQTPQAGKLENLMGILGTVGGLAGGVGELSGLFGGGGGGAQQMASGGGVPYDPNIYKSVRF